MNQPSEMTRQPLLLTPKEAAQMLAISERTLWTLSNSGSIPRLKIGASVRYKFKDLEKFVEAKAVASPQKDC